jgi:hypothetical protein
MAATVPRGGLLGRPRRGGGAATRADETRGDHGAGQQRGDERQGDTDGELAAEGRVEPYHLEADEDQHQGQPVAQQVKALYRSAQHEEHRAQAEDREDVGGEDDEGLPREREDGGHRVDREHHVAGLQTQQGHEQGSHADAAVLADDETLVAEPVRHRKPSADGADDRVALGIGRLAAADGHLQAGDDEEQPEEPDQPVELQQDGAQGDESGAEAERAQDAVEQHPVLVSRRHREIAEDQHEDEHVVDRQRVLDDVTGEGQQAEVQSEQRQDAGHEQRVEPPGLGEREEDSHRRPSTGVISTGLRAWRMTRSCTAPSQGPAAGGAASSSTSAAHLRACSVMARPGSLYDTRSHTTSTPPGRSGVTASITRCTRARSASSQAVRAAR